MCVSVVESRRIADRTICLRSQRDGRKYFNIMGTPSRERTRGEFADFIAVRVCLVSLPGRNNIDRFLSRIPLELHRRERYAFVGERLWKALVSPLSRMTVRTVQRLLCTTSRDKLDGCTCRYK